MADAAGQQKWAIAVVVVLILLMAYLILRRGGGKSGFVSKRAAEVYGRAAELFARGGGDTSYTEYRRNVPEADPVQFNDVRNLYRRGRMTPESVQQVL